MRKEPTICPGCGRTSDQPHKPLCRFAPPVDPTDLPLFSQPINQPMARLTDPETSHEAAEHVIPVLGKIQRLVAESYARHGPMTAKECESLPEFAHYGYSTIRKRICELSAGDERTAPLLVDTTERRGTPSSIVWKLRTGGTS